MPPRSELIRRIVLAGRARTRGNEADAASTARTEGAQLQARIDQLEAIVEGLQDSVHRETTRLNERIAELEHRIEPQVLSRALNEDARRRGIA
jgi:BMFP domain-containing protein YqiC